TAHVCAHHLHFSSDDYERLGNQIKCNPAIKSPNNKTALWNALLDDRLDVVATDHAPHSLNEKAFYRNDDGLLSPSPLERPARLGHSGGPGVRSSYEHAHAGLPL